MPRRSSPLFILALLLLASSAQAKTLLVKGTMSAKIRLTEQNDFSVKDAKTSFTYKLALPSTDIGNISSQKVSGLEVQVTPKPAQVSDSKDRFGNVFRTFTWKNLEEDVRVRLSCDVELSESLNPVTSSAAFPLAAVPQAARPYLAASEQTQSEAQQIRAQAKKLTEGARFEHEAVTEIVRFTANHITYSYNPKQYDALYALKTGDGNCQNYAHLAVALLRASGIPARAVGGFTLKEKWKVPAGKGSSIVYGVVQGGHAWLEVWYPDLGWLPYDPQQSMQFVSTRHIKETHGLQVSGITSTWMSTAPTPTLHEQLTSEYLVDAIDLDYQGEADEPKRYVISNLVQKGTPLSETSPAPSQPEPLQATPAVVAKAPVVAPKAPVTVPKAPVTVPKEPVVAPKEPVVAPKEPVVAPKEPVVAPKEPVVAPKEPVVAPKEPVVAPKEPVVAPKEPVAVPAPEVTAPDIVPTPVVVAPLVIPPTPVVPPLPEVAPAPEVAPPPPEVAPASPDAVPATGKGPLEKAKTPPDGTPTPENQKPVPPAESEVLFGNSEFPESVVSFNTEGETSSPSFSSETAEYVTGGAIYAQAFTVDHPMSLTGVELAMKKFGGSGAVYIDVVKDDGGKPGLDGTRSLPRYLDALSRTPGYAWVEFKLPSSEGHTAPGKYWIVLRRSGDAVMNWFFTPSKRYGGPDDTRSTAKGWEWEDLLTYEFVFRVKGRSGS